MLLLGADDFFGGRLANHPGEALARDGVPRCHEPVVEALPRRFRHDSRWAAAAGQTDNRLARPPPPHELPRRDSRYRGAP